jgi:hypothetical protein
MKWVDDGYDFYDFGKMCLTLREERRLRIFENRFLKRILGPYEE